LKEKPTLLPEHTTSTKHRYHWDPGNSSAKQLMCSSKQDHLTIGLAEYRIFGLGVALALTPNKEGVHHLMAT
jgi:hypothetical protein